MLSKIEDRAERLKVEREAQKRAGELKRVAQRLSSARGGGSLDSRNKEGAFPPPREVKLTRGGVPLSKEPPLQEIYQATTSREIAVGDKVKLKSFGSIGIVDSIKDDVAEVRVKSLRLRERLDNLELMELSIPAKSKVDKRASLSRSFGTEVSLKSDESSRSELNVIGRTTDEAVDAVDKFLDEASLAGVNQLRLIHGHGTGALRKAITEMLKGHPHVERFNPAPQDQGGSGATIVELKQ